MQINYIVFVDTQGAIVTAKGCNLESKSDLSLPINFSYHLSKGRLLINHESLTHTYTGIIDTASGPLMVSAQPILKTDATGPSNGTIIFGRFLTKENFSLYKDANSTVELKQITLQQSDDIRIDTPNDKTIISSFDIHDIYDSPLVRVVTKTPRVIFSRRIVAYQYLFISLFCGGFLLLLSQYFIVEQLITRKVLALIRAVVDITKQKKVYTIDIPIITNQKDEINTLQNAINAMLRTLQELSSGITDEQNKAQQYLDLMNTIVRVLDKEHNILVINKKGCDLLGYTKEELVGKNWIQTIVSPEQKDQVKNILDDIVANKIHQNELIENQSEILTKSGKRLLVRWHHSLVRDDAGNAVSVVSSGFDMTAEMDAKTQLETRIKEMEQINKLMINRELEMIKLKKKLQQYET